MDRAWSTRWVGLCHSARHDDNGRGHGRDAGKGGRGRGITGVEIGTEQEYVDEDAGLGGRGGRTGVRFGCGGYRNWLLRAQNGEQATPSLELLGLILVLFVLLCPKHTGEKQKISVISKRLIGNLRRDSWDNNKTVQGHIARNEMNTHTDTCCTGSNWTPMHYTREIC